MNAIVAVDRNWAIGRDNGLLFSLPGDMKRFRALTAGPCPNGGTSSLPEIPLFSGRAARWFTVRQRRWHWQAAAAMSG